MLIGAVTEDAWWEVVKGRLSWNDEDVRQFRDDLDSRSDWDHTLIGFLRSSFGVLVSSWSNLDPAGVAVLELFGCERSSVHQHSPQVPFVTRVDFRWIRAVYSSIPEVPLRGRRQIDSLEYLLHRTAS